MTIARSAIGILAVAGTLLAHVPAAAQVNSLGFRFGLSRANMGGGFNDLVERRGGDTNSRTSVVVGAYVDYGLSLLDGRLSILAGMDLTPKGMRVPGDNGLKERVLNVTYLDIPVLAKAILPVTRFQPYAVAGPVPSFKLSAKGEVEGEASDVGDELTSTDLGFALGVGGRRGPFGVELRYILGLPNVTTSTDEDESAKNRTWTLVGTYEIPLQR